MAEDKDKEKDSKAGERSTRDEVALEMMKFVAVTTGYGKGPSGAGYGAKGGRSAEEYADSLLELFEKCRAVVAKAQ